MSRMILLLTSLLLVLSSALFGQITVNNDFMPSPGTVINYVYDISPDQGVFDQMSAGSGPSMMWDFSSRSYGSQFMQTSVELATTPEIDSFPTANYVLLQVINGNDSLWQPVNSVAGSYTGLGSISHLLGLEYVLKYFDQTPEWIFPINYNSQWTSHRHLRQQTEFTYTLTFDTTSYMVDAWGTVKYLTKSAPCLRVRSVDRIYTKIYNVGSDVPSDSFLTTTTAVSFITSEFNTSITVAKVESNGSTTYTSTALADFVGQPAAVVQTDNGTVPSDFALSQNYPNPFNPSTEIEFSVPRSSEVSLAVYDVLGRQVKLVLDEDMAAGAYAVDWGGTDDSGQQVASGVYFYRLTAGQYAETKKMTLLK